MSLKTQRKYAYISIFPDFFLYLHGVWQRSGLGDIINGVQNNSDSATDAIFSVL